jgi:nitrogen-specific signal transduction histidine kinase
LVNGVSALLPGVVRNIGLELVGNQVVTVVLACSIAAVWWLQRHYLANQQSLRQLKMLAHDILASMDRGVVTTDREGTVTSINSAALHLLGVDFECVGRPLACISSTEIPLVELRREVAERQAPVRDRDCTMKRASRVLRLRVDGDVLKDDEGTALGCVLHLHDETERMLLSERMRRMERFLSLATLASGLHHEIKNPLTALSIHIQLLEEALAHDACAKPATARGKVSAGSADELVAVLKTEVCRLNGVLESFRTFANLQHLTLEPTDALAVVDNVIRLVHPQSAAQGVRITLLHPESELPPVRLDAAKFEQAVLNLVINALEAMPEGGSLSLNAGVVDGEFRLAVKDSGPGISPDVQKNLFQPYFSTKSKGTGIGLALSEKLIGQHGGHIEFQTGAAGTTFTVTVPLEQGNGTP